MKVKNTRDILSTLWLVLMLNMIFNDIFGFVVMLDKFVRPELPGDAQTLMLVAVFLTNIPLLMILFAKILNYKINRILNIAVAIFTILYVWGGMSTYPHYIVIAAIETIIALVIIVVAWKWKNDAAVE
ncbi:MAG: DUF6326 family protein [bacterium]